jgi:AraC-like DNA-binding protein
MWRVAAHIPFPDVLWRLVGKLRGTATIARCLTRRSLLVRARAEQVHAVFVSIAEPSGGPIGPFLTHFRSAFPTVPCVVVAHPRPADTRLIAPALRAGADQVLLIGIDDGREVLCSLLHTLADDDRLIESMATRRLRPNAAFLFNLCCRCARVGTGRAALAAQLGVESRGMERLFDTAGLPSPARTIAWARLLIAASHLQRGHYSVERAAAIASFPSAAALGRTSQRLAMMRPSELRSAAAVGHLWDRLTESMSTTDRARNLEICDDVALQAPGRLETRA